MAAPEDDERCTRNYGKKWRCKKARKQGETLCDQHYVKEMGKLRRPEVGKGSISQQQPSPFMGKLNLIPNEKEIKNPPFVTPLRYNRELSVNMLTKDEINKESDGSSINEKGKVNKVALNTFQPDVKDLEDCTAEAKLKDVGSPVTSMDDPVVKAKIVDDSWLEQEPMIVYKRRAKTTTLTTEKLKMNHLADHVSSVKEEPLMMSSDMVDKVSSRPKEEEKKYSVVTEADHVPITKMIQCCIANQCHPANNEEFGPNFLMETTHHEIPPVECHPANNEEFGPNFLMETTHHEIPPVDVRNPLSPNLVHTTTSVQKTSKMIAQGLSGVVASSIMKHNEEDISSLDASFSISACMKELKKYHYIPIMKRIKAVKELQSEDWRETFLCMDEDMRKAWIESLE